METEIEELEEIPLERKVSNLESLVLNLVKENDYGNRISFEIELLKTLFPGKINNSSFVKKEKALLLMDISGMFLKYCSASLKNDKEVVISAIKNSKGRAIFYALEGAKKNNEVKQTLLDTLLTYKNTDPEEYFSSFFSYRFKKNFADCFVEKTFSMYVDLIKLRPFNLIGSLDDSNPDLKPYIYKFIKSKDDYAKYINSVKEFLELKAKYDTSFVLEEVKRPILLSLLFANAKNISDCFDDVENFKKSLFEREILDFLKAITIERILHFDSSSTAAEVFLDIVKDEPFSGGFISGLTIDDVVNSEKFYILLKEIYQDYLSIVNKVDSSSS